MHALCRLLRFPAPRGSTGGAGLHRHLTSRLTQPPTGAIFAPKNCLAAPRGLFFGVPCFLAIAMFRAARIVLVGFGLFALGDLVVFGILGASQAGESAGIALAVSATFLAVDLAGLVGTLRGQVWGPVVMAVMMGLLALVTRTYAGPWWETAIWLVGVGVAIAVAIGLDRDSRPVA